MATDDLERTALRLGRFADDLAHGGPLPAADPDLDPALAATVRRLHRLNQGPAPADARQRVWRQLLDDTTLPGLANTASVAADARNIHRPFGAAQNDRALAASLA